MTTNGLTAAAAPSEATPTTGPGRITVPVEELLAALDTVAPHGTGQLPVLTGAWALIEPHRLRLTATDRHTLATTLTRGTDSDGTWSGRIAPVQIEQLRTALRALPDWQSTEPVTLSGTGDQLTITGPAEPITITSTADALPEAVAATLAAATTAAPILATGMSVGPQLLARFAAMAGPEPVFLHLANNDASHNSAHMLVLASRTALGVAPLRSDETHAGDVAELWSELHHSEQPAPTTPEQPCPEHYAGALVCTLPAGHHGKHRNTNGRTWWWDD